MEKMIFSQTNIEQLIADNELTIDDLLIQFERPDLIGVARYVDSSGLPWGSWRNVIALIDDFLLEEKWVFYKNKNHIVNVNVAYFAPSSFLRIGSLELLNTLQSCTQLQLNFIFTQPKILQFLANLLMGDISEIVLEKMNSSFFLGLLQAFTQGNYLKPERECWLCNRFIQIKKLPANDLCQILLKHRIASLQISENKLPEKPSYKIALCITGQLRGFEVAITRFKAKFAHLGEIDAYVSTWDEVGYTRFNLQNAYRIFDKKVLDYIIEQKDTLDLSKFDEEIYRYTAKLYPIEKIKELLKEKLDWCQEIHINMKNHQEYPYNKMSNSEKMYYHNSYWIETLGEEYFRQYDIIIKIRPDYFFKDNIPISVNELSNLCILTDTDNYLMQEWGFGIGDQVWIGMPQAILPLMLCHDRQSLSYQYMQFSHMKEFMKIDLGNLHMLNPRIENGQMYQGHVNCGLQAWFAGLRLISDNNVLAKSRLSSVRLIEFEEFLQMDVNKN